MIPFIRFDDPLYRAHLERYAAAAVSLASSPYSTSGALMSSYNPALFSQLLPPQPLSRVTSHVATPGHHTLATASPGHHRSHVDTSKKSGNANAPSSTVPGWEGPTFSLTTALWASIRGALTIVSITNSLGAIIIKLSISARQPGHVINLDFYIILYLLL